MGFLLNPLANKLRCFVDLSEDDESVLAELTQPMRRIERQGDLIPEDAEPRSIVIILDGWACRYEQLEDGRRQTVTLYLPGDLCGPFGTLLPVMDQAIGTLTSVTYAQPTLADIKNAVG